MKTLKLTFDGFGLNNEDHPHKQRVATIHPDYRKHGSDLAEKASGKIGHVVAVVATYIPATNYKGSRVKLSLPRWENKRIFREWDSALGGDCQRQGQAVLEAAGIEVAGFAELEKGYAILCPFGQHEAIAKLFKLPAPTDLASL